MEQFLNHIPYHDLVKHFEMVLSFAAISGWFDVQLETAASRRFGLCDCGFGAQEILQEFFMTRIDFFIIFRIMLL